MTATHLLDALMHLLYPAVCISCESPLSEDERFICSRCDADLDAFLLPNESTDLMMTKLRDHFPNQTAIDDALSRYLFHKHGKFQAIAHAIKYDGLSQLAVLQGERLGRLILEERPTVCVDAIVPMPLHKLKFIERGYNQSERIAVGISRLLSVPVKSLVERTRYTSSQTGFDLRGRMTNMKDAFICPTPFSEKHLLLVDDVFTTGSTLYSCARALKQSGAAHITIATLAVAST